MVMRTSVGAVPAHETQEAYLSREAKVPRKRALARGWSDKALPKCANPRPERDTRSRTLALPLVGCLLWGCVQTSLVEDQTTVLGPPALATVLAGLPAERPLRVELVTDRGIIPCQLDPERTPLASAMFVGFALGRAAWRDPKTNKITERAMYRDLPFVRGIPGLLIQAGDPVGNATGQPGYRIPVEADDADPGRLAVPGALALARYTPPPNRIDPAPPPEGHVIGSQFVVLLTNMAHLAGRVTVIGRCENLELAQATAEALAQGRSRPRLLEVRVAARSRR